MISAEPTLANVHPGEILAEDFMKPLGLTAYRLSKNINVPQTRISEITHGQRALTEDMAARLAQYFNMTPQFWMGLQAEYDLRELLRQRGESYRHIETIGGVTASSEDAEWGCFAESLAASMGESTARAFDEYAAKNGQTVTGNIRRVPTGFIVSIHSPDSARRVLLVKPS